MRVYVEQGYQLDLLGIKEEHFRNALLCVDGLHNRDALVAIFSLIEDVVSRPMISSAKAIENCRQNVPTIQIVGVQIWYDVGSFPLVSSAVLPQQVDYRFTLDDLEGRADKDPSRILVASMPRMWPRAVELAEEDALANVQLPLRHPADDGEFRDVLAVPELLWALAFLGFAGVQLWSRVR